MPVSKLKNLALLILLLASRPHISKKVTTATLFLAAVFGLSPLDTLCRTAAGAVRVLIAVLAVFALLMILSTSVVVFVGR